MLHETSGRDGFKSIAGHADDCSCLQSRKRQRFSTGESTQRLDADLHPNNVHAETDPEVTLPVDVFLPSGGKISLRCPPEAMACKISKIVCAADAV